MLPTQGAPQAADQGFHFIHLFHHMPELHTCTSWSPMEPTHQRLNYKIKESFLERISSSTRQEILSRNDLPLVTSGLTLRLLAEIKMCVVTK